MPRMAGFVASHPALRIHFVLEDRKQDLIRDVIAISIQIDKLVDSIATVRMMGQIARMFVALPAYLARDGTPVSPRDLAQHRMWNVLAPRCTGGWTTTRGRKTEKAEIAAHVITSEDDGAVAAAVTGVGIATVSA